MAVASVGEAAAEGDQYPAMLWRCAEVEYRPGGWIVGLDNASSINIAQLVEGSLASSAHPNVPAHPVTNQRGLGSAHQAFIDADVSLSYDQLNKALSKLPGFRYIEPDFIIRSESTFPNDPKVSGLYGLENIGAFDAWDLASGAPTGQEIVVGVIDSGIDYTHPDLAANVWTNPGEIPGDRIDNDKNGYVDDVHGYDFLNLDSDPMDDNGHGTHVSGTIAAAGNNGLGVAGVSWNAKVMGLKFLGANGSGPISAAVNALNYATNMHAKNPRIKLTNNSWGGGSYSQSMSDALTANAASDMLFIAAAGNAAADNDATASYPSGYPQSNIIAVASVDSSDSLSSFSSYGATTVDLAAPGSGILSTYPGNDYRTMSGTSMATPHVAGAAALAWSVAPTASYSQIRDALFQGVDELPALVGKTATGGRLNIANTIRNLLGDSGDTLAGARSTNLDALGDQFRVPAARLGDGVAGAHDVDIYRFSAPAGATFSASTRTPAGGTAVATILRVFDSAGTEIAANIPGDGNAALNLTLAAAGVYYLGVSGGVNAAYDPMVAGSGGGGTTGDYRLTLQLDIGDDLQSAKPISFSSEGKFTQFDTRGGDGLYGGRDVDLYQFTASAGSLLSAYTAQKSSGDPSDTVLRLLDNSGAVLASSDRAASLNASLDYQIGVSNTYYLAVSGAGNTTYSPTVAGSGSVGATGDYSLKVSLGPISSSNAAEVNLQSLVGSDRSQGFVMSGGADYAELTASGSMPVGDMNGDGIDDFIVAATGDIGAGPIATVYLIFGVDGASGNYPAELDLSSLDGTNGYRIEAVAMTDRTGLIGGGAGDINGDGRPDLIVGAIAASPSPALNDAGQSYVLFGDDLSTGHLASLDALDGGLDGLIHLANLNGTDGFAINAEIAGGLGGRAFGVGDINKDGYGDMVIGAPAAASSAGVANAGIAYLVYGRSTFSSVVDLATLNGVDGFRIPPLAISGNLGISAGGAGDLNGDGVDDFFVGSSSADALGMTNAGQLHVVFGNTAFGKTNTSNSFDLNSLNGANGFTVNGSAPSDGLGGTAAYVGDVNADGRGDLLIMASGADFNGRSGAGAGYILFGKSTTGTFPSTLDARAIEGSYGTLLIGPEAGGLMASAGYGGDFNGDGAADIVVSNRYADPNGVLSAGQTFVLYGGNTLPARLDLSSLLSVNGGDGSAGRVFNGFLTNSGMAGSMIGDVNHDGIDDLRIRAPYVDVRDETAAGQVYVVFGQAMNAGVRVSPSTGLQTTEAGGKATFTVRLNTQPSSTVTIPLAVSDTTEGSLSATSLQFTSANWNIPQTVTVTGLDDALKDGAIAYEVQLKTVVTADVSYQGIDPVNASVLNLDNDTLYTRFYVNNDASPDRTYEYSSSGAAVENYAINSGNSAPRGSATAAAGNIVWVVDSNRKVFAYSPSGALQGTPWTAGTVPSSAQLEGIATNGTDIWLVDNKSDRVYRYTNGASRHLTGGTLNSASSFLLNSANKNPKDIVTDGTYLWVVNDGAKDQVFKYTLTGTLVASWFLSTTGASAPTGIALDPAKPNDLWIVDSGTDRVYQFSNAINQASGTSRSADTNFALGSGNTNPQGISLAPTVVFGLSTGGEAASGDLSLASPGVPKKARWAAAVDDLFGSNSPWL